MDWKLLTDEELVRIAQKTPSPYPVNELTERYLPRMRRWISRAARCWRLCHDDIRDAQQQAFFSLQEAVADFRPGGQPLAALLWFRVRSRFHDYARQHQRSESRLDRAVDVYCAHDQAPARAVACADPSRQAEREEVARRVNEEVGRLPALERELCKQVLDGKPLRAIARLLCLDYPVLYRRWQRARARLAAGMSGWN